MFKVETCFDYSFVEMDETDFFVIGRCTSGSRHYSEYLSSLGKAFEMFDIYADLVDYSDFYDLEWSNALMSHNISTHILSIFLS